MKKKYVYFDTLHINWGFVLLASICILFMFAEIINHRFWLSDFEVYYKAANRILYSQNLYRIKADGHYIFKYSPTSAIYCIPFLIFPFSVARYIYWIFLTTIIIWGFYLSIKIIKPSLVENKNIRYNSRIVFFATLVLALHFLRELHLGQVNYILLFLYILAIYFYKNKKRISFSTVVALSIFIKPFTLIFIPFLILKKKYSELLMFLGFSIVLFLLPFLFYGSTEITLNQYHLWLNELMIELSHKQSLLQDANHTLFSVVARYSPIRYILVNNTITAMYQIVLLVGIGIVFLWFTNIKIKNCVVEQEEYYSLLEFSMLLALIPLLAFTSENAFIYAQLLVFIILIYFKKLNTYEKGLAITGFILIGGNFSEILGKSLSKKIDDMSLIAIGTIILISLLYTLRTRGVLISEEENRVFDKNRGVLD